MNFTLVFSDKELDYIANCLAQRPWQEVNAILASIQQQVHAAQHEAQGFATGVAEKSPPVPQERMQQVNGRAA